MRTYLIFYAVVIFSSILSFVGMEIINDVLQMHRLAERDNPYWVPQFAGILYVGAPLFTVAICIFFLSPGLLLADALCVGNNPITWVLVGFSISLGLITGITILVQNILGEVLRDTAFFSVVLLLNVFTLAASLGRRTIGHHDTLNFNGAGRDLLFAALTAWAVLLLMSAKFYWENLSSDGAGVLNFSRLFINTNWPFWPQEAGAISAGPGLTSFLFVLPASWFVRLLGENEFAVRAPHILYLSTEPPLFWFDVPCHFGARLPDWWLVTGDLS